MSTTYKKVADSNFDKNKELKDQLVNVWSTEKVNTLFERVENGEKLDKSPFWEGDPDFRAANIVFQYTDEEKAILERCASDVEYFASFCHVMTDDGIQKIILRDYQQDVLRDYTNNRQCVFLAPRQSGKTIATSIFLAHYLIFNTDRNLMILANVGSTTEELIDKIKVILRHLPFFMKPGMIVNNVMTMKFDNGCRLYGKTTTKNSGIGFTVHFLYIDEFAHIHPSFLDKLWRSLYPTLSSSKISRIIITSTPNGTNKFYEIYTKAMAGENSFCPMRIYWWQVPGRDEAWKLQEINDLGSEEDFAQEYDCDFLTSNQKLLDAKTLQRMNSMATIYKWAEITAIEDALAGTEIKYNNLKWHPKFSFDNVSDDDRFVISIDTAGGGGGRADFTVMNIFKLIPMPISQIVQKTNFQDETDFFSLMQIGMYRDNKTPIEDVQPILEQLIYKVFGVDRVRIVLEMDFKGALLYEKMSRHKDFFEDMFVHTKHSENAKMSKPGLKLNPKNKMEFCLETRQLVKSGRIIVNEKTSYAELADFGQGETGGYKSQTGHDDIAMTCINLAPYFRSSQYLEHVDEIYSHCPQKYKDAMAERMNRDDDQEPDDYSFLKDML